VRWGVGVSGELPSDLLRRLRRLLRAVERQAGLLRVRAHEFHRTVSEPAHGGSPAWRLPDGTQAGWAGPSLLASYLHLHWAGLPHAADRLVQAAVTGRPASGARRQRTSRPSAATPVPSAPLTPPGHVTLVGAGPGSTDLITLRGWQALHSADVVISDRLADPAFTAELRPGVLLIYAGKAPGEHRLRPPCAALDRGQWRDLVC
jgi:Tetrapyrrole (Corrin/Porphyrin) Methylases